MCMNIFKNNRVHHWSIHHDALQDHTDLAPMTHIHVGSRCQLVVGLARSICLCVPAQISAPVRIVVLFVATQPGDSGISSFHTLWDFLWHCINSPIISDPEPSPQSHVRLRCCRLRLQRMCNVHWSCRGSFEIGWLSFLAGMLSVFLCVCTSMARL